MALGNPLPGQSLGSLLGPVGGARPKPTTNFLDDLYAEPTLEELNPPEPPPPPRPFSIADAAKRAYHAFEEAPTVAANYYSGGGLRHKVMGGAPPVPISELAEDIVAPPDEAARSYPLSIGRKLAGTVAELATSPTNAALLLASGGASGIAPYGRAIPDIGTAAAKYGAARLAQRGISLGFGASMVPATVEKIGHGIGQVRKEGFTPTAAGELASGGLDAIMAGGALAHGLLPRAIPSIEEASAKASELHPDVPKEAQNTETGLIPYESQGLARYEPPVVNAYPIQGQGGIVPIDVAAQQPRMRQPLLPPPLPLELPPPKARLALPPAPEPPTSTIGSGQAISEPVAQGAVPHGEGEAKVTQEPRFAFRARDVGEQGIPGVGHSQASLSEADVRRIAPSRTEGPQEVVKVDLSKLQEGQDYVIHERPGADPWVQFKRAIPEEMVEKHGSVSDVDRQAASKAEPPLRAAVAGAAPEMLAEKTGLPTDAVEKGKADVDADGTREFSPEAVAVKRAALEGVHDQPLSTEHGQVDANTATLTPAAKVGGGPSDAIQPAAIQETPAVETPKYSVSKPTQEQEARAKAEAGRQTSLPTEPREPWQMTGAEWDAAFNKTRVNYSGTGGEQFGLGRRTSEKGHGSAISANRAEQDRLKMGLPDRDMGDGLKAPARHYQVVKEAVRRNLPVPAEVLAEYPDLKPPTPTAEPQDRKLALSVSEKAADARGEKDTAKYAVLDKEQPEPPVTPGMVRLYRGEVEPGQTKNVPPWVASHPEFAAIKEATGRWFAPSRSEAEWYANDAAVGGRKSRILYIDVPDSLSRESLVANNATARRWSAKPYEEYLLPRDAADAARTEATSHPPSESADFATKTTQDSSQDRRSLHERISKTFSKLPVQPVKDGYVLPTPSGRRILIKPTGEIVFRPEALEAGHGPKAATDVASGKLRIAGATQTLGRDSLIQIADKGVLPHESLHVFLDHFAHPKEHAAIRSAFEEQAKSEGRSWEETAADAYNAWFDKPETQKGPVARFFQSIRDFVDKIRQVFSPTAEGTFRKVKEGDVFRREAGTGGAGQAFATGLSENFKRWFGESKVVDEKGEPRIVYHGTAARFNKFNPKKATMGGIHWFTSDKASIERGEVGAQGKGRIMDLYASLKNPAGWDEYHKLGLGELKARGYDGALLPESDGTITGFVFDSTQLKSASKNVGTFDPNNPDIRYATAPKRPEDVPMRPPSGAGQKDYLGKEPPPERKPLKPIPFKPMTEADRLGRRAAETSKVTDKIAATFDVMNEKFRIAEEQAGRVEDRGTIDKESRPAFRKAGQPDAEATKGFRFSSEDIQRSGREMVDAVKAFRESEMEFRRAADPNSAEAMKFARQTMERAVKQWQVYRSAAGRAVKTFDRPIPADVIQSLREAGNLARVKEVKEKVPITTNIINSLKNWKNLTDAEKTQFRRDLVDQYRLNLFSTTSFTLDLVGNGTEFVGQTAGGAARDLARFSRGDFSFPSMQGLLRAIRSGAPWNAAPPEIEGAFKRTATGEQLKKGGTFTYRSNKVSKVYDYMVGLPLYAKGTIDTGAKRLGAMSTLYRDAMEAAHDRGLRGLDREKFVNDFVNHPSEEASARAIANGQKAGFDRPLSMAEEKFASSTTTRLLVSPFARWPFQFTRWAGEMLGYNPEIISKLRTGKLSREDLSHYLAKTATGWGGLYMLNKTVYDRTDFNSMEYVDDDGNRVRLSNRDPIPTALWLLALIKGDEAKFAKGLQYASVPGAALLSGESGGLLTGLVQNARRALENTQSDPRALKRELDDTINRAIPGQAVLSLIETLIDPKIREGIGANLPGVSLMKPAAIDPVTGEPLEPRQRVLGVEIPSIGGTPIPGATRILDPVQKLLSRFGLIVYRGPRSPIAGYPPGEVPEDMRREWQESFGKYRQKLLSPLARAMGTLEKRDPEKVRKMIQERDTAAAKYADREMGAKYGGKRKLPRQPTMREMARPTVYQEEQP